MLNILHGIAAVAFAMLLELFSGNWGWMIPFCACVLNRVTAKFQLPWVFLSGLGTGLIFDLIFWRKFPSAALSMALTVTLVRLVKDSSKFRNRFANALVSGALTGVLMIFLMALLQGYPDGRHLPLKFHLVSSFAGAVIFQILISPLGGKGEAPERQVQKGEKKTPKSPPRKERSAPKTKPAGRKK